MAILNRTDYRRKRWARLRRALQAEGAVLSFPEHLGGPLELAFVLNADKVDRVLTRAVVEITAEGRPLAMLVPVALLNGNLDVDASWR